MGTTEDIPPKTPGVPELTVKVFGPMQVWVWGERLPRTRSRKSLWLLALLILRHDRPVERGWLAGTLWPDTEQSRSLANLAVALSELRAALGDQKTRIEAPSRQTILLKLGSSDHINVDVDVVAFDTALKSEDLSSLREAVELYQGVLLEGCPEDWVLQERQEREQKCLHALATLAEAAANDRDHDRAHGYWQRALILDPLWDRARRGAMTALAALGDRNAALHVYREFTNLLKSGPYAVPDTETTKLYQTLRTQPPKSSGTTPVTAATPAKVGVDKTTKGYLPHALTPLVGREKERGEVSAKLRESRLVTLTGPGGIGKTRLALEVATEAGSEFTDGVWLVALESLSDRQMLAPQIAVRFGLKEERARSCLSTVTDYLRTSRLLLVLDNCEHLLGESAEVTAHLLGECADLQILATSREALGITGETIWAVPPLAVPALSPLPQSSAALVVALLGCESVQLFLERARAAQRTFVLTQDNALLVSQVCTRLEGIPLAIEFAAARVNSMTLEQMAERLDDQLGLLTKGSSVALSRQQTLRATLDWSFDLLSEREQTLLTRLSVFAGGWNMEAAEEICVRQGIDQKDIFDLLSSLTDKSLVVYQQGESEGRFRLLEMVRQYSAEKLFESGALKQVRSRHRDWYLALAEQAKQQVKGQNQQIWLERLEIEHDNLRAALQCCAEEADPGGTEAGLQLASALWGFWQVRGYNAEGRGHLERALAQDHGQVPTLWRARTLGALGSAFLLQSDYAAAQTFTEEAFSIYEALSDSQGIAVTGNGLGNIAYVQGHYLSARALYEESLKHRRALNDWHGTALTLNNLGNIAGHLGKSDAAAAMYEESLQIRRELGDTRGIAYALRSLGSLANARGDYGTARALYEEALRLRRELGDESGIAESLINLGVNALYRSDYASALELFEQGENMHRKLGDPHHIALCLGNQAEVHYLLKNYASASALYTESLKLRREVGDQYGIAVSLQGMGLIAQALGDATGAERLVREGLILFTERGEKKGIAECLRIYGTLNGEKQEYAASARLYGATAALHQSFGIVLAPTDRLDFERQAAVVRAALGEGVFSSEWEQGLALTWEQAAAYALGDETAQ